MYGCGVVEESINVIDLDVPVEVYIVFVSDVYLI